ncbi:MAG TPA: BON domain-containing protein [Gammaproteobacteria bacterium]
MKSVLNKLSLFAVGMCGIFTLAMAEGNYSDQGSADTDRTMTQTAKDAWIQGKLEATFAYDGDLSSFAINTTVKNGVVNLKGNVESQAEKDRATRLAKNIDGVTKVENNLRVKPSTDQEKVSLNN